MPQKSQQQRLTASGPGGDEDRLSELRELQLVEAHRDGDADALGELLQAYQRRVYTICYRMLRNTDEAADLTQDTLVRLVQHLHRYDGRAKLSTWVIRIAMNACISHLRKKRVRQAELLASGDSNLQPESFAEQRQPGRVEREEMRSVLDKAISSLEPDMRSVLVLRDMQGLEYEQMAAALEIPVGTVKSRLFRARAVLRNAMDRYEAGGED